MTSGVLLGLLIVILAGIGTGSGAWPYKLTKDIRLEQYLFTQIFVGLFLIPWGIAFCFFDVHALVGALPNDVIVKSLIFSGCWGIANVLCNICFVMIGAALTGAILSALGTSVAVLLPLVYKAPGIYEDAPDLFSQQGLFILGAVVLFIVGVVFATVAGVGRERVLSGKKAEERRSQASGSFATGLLLVVIAGICSAGLGLSIAYTQADVMKAAEATCRVQNPETVKLLAQPVVGAVAMFGGVMVNLLYCVFMLTKNKTWGSFFARPNEVVFGVLCGIQFIASILCLGQGMIMIGAAGAAIANGIKDAIQLLSNQAVGFWGGEWRGVHGRPRRQMYTAILIIVITAVVLAVSSTPEAKSESTEKATEAPVAAPAPAASASVEVDKP